MIPNQGIVILVDDDPDMGVIYVPIMRKEGLHIEICSTGQEALDRVSNGGVALVLVDYEMPGMSGPELVEKLTQKYPTLLLLYLTSHMDLTEFPRNGVLAFQKAHTTLEITTLARMLKSYIKDTVLTGRLDHVTITLTGMDLKLDVIGTAVSGFVDTSAGRFEAVSQDISRLDASMLHLASRTKTSQWPVISLGLLLFLFGLLGGHLTKFLVFRTTSEGVQR